jgi:hypothetical protein
MALTSVSDCALYLTSQVEEVALRQRRKLGQSTPCEVNQNPVVARLHQYVVTSLRAPNDRESSTMQRMPLVKFTPQL